MEAQATVPSKGRKVDENEYPRQKHLMKEANNIRNTTKKNVSIQVKSGLSRTTITEDQAGQMKNKKLEDKDLSLRQYSRRGSRRRPRCSKSLR